MKNKILIPLANEPSVLGPMGGPDPTDFINAETNHIPFKNSSFDSASWNNAFRSWPSAIPRWRNWFKRIESHKRVFWDEHDIGQCLTLSLSEMEKNKSLLIAASHFWSDAINVFLFKHGLMTPTLADVLMLTGLNISASDQASSLLVKPTHKLQTKIISGWKGYIVEHSGTGSVTPREYTTFLNMWLERFIFYGKTCGPTSNMQSMAESLANGNTISLSKHLLGAVYHLLHQVFEIK